MVRDTTRLATALVAGGAASAADGRSGGIERGADGETTEHAEMEISSRR